MYPIVICDALRVKIRDTDSRMVKNKAVYVALGVSRDGVREVLGLRIADNEGAKFWLSVMTELKNRGLQDIQIAVVDGLKGFPPLGTLLRNALPGSGCHHRSLSRHGRANVHCPSRAPLAELLCLERSQGGGRRSAADLQCANRQPTWFGVGYLRGKMGREVGLYRPCLAQGLAGGNTVLCL